VDTPVEVVEAENVGRGRWCWDWELGDEDGMGLKGWWHGECKGSSPREGQEDWVEGCSGERAHDFCWMRHACTHGLMYVPNLE